MSGQRLIQGGGRIGGVGGEGRGWVEKDGRDEDSESGQMGGSGARRIQLVEAHAG